MTWIIEGGFWGLECCDLVYRSYKVAQYELRKLKCCDLEDSGFLGILDYDGLYLLFLFNKKVFFYIIISENRTITIYLMEISNFCLIVGLIDKVCTL